MDRRNLLKHVCAFGAAVPFLDPIAALARASDESILATVHPELREAAKTALRYTGQPMTHATLPQSRQLMASIGQKPTAEVPFERRVLPGHKGQPDVMIYLINAKPNGARPAILHTHGGGFVSGTALNNLFGLQQLCQKLDCVAVSVEYRLAPETTYLGSTEDNYSGLKWLHANAAQLGVDPMCIAVMGESAGGGHAALLAIMARDRGEVPLCFQCLTYPMLDDRTGSTRPVPGHIGKMVWTAQNNGFGWESFLGTKPGARRVPAAVPARVGNLAGLPPAWIGVGSIDLFVDEDIDYAQRLNNAGVPAELIVVPGAFHAFDGMAPNAHVTHSFNVSKLEALRGGLGMSA